MFAAARLSEGQPPLREIPAYCDCRKATELTEFVDGKVFAFDHDSYRSPTPAIPRWSKQGSPKGVLTLFAFRNIALRFLGGFRCRALRGQCSRC